MASADLEAAARAKLAAAGEGFKRVDAAKGAARAAALKETVATMHEAKRAIKEWEREARMDGVDQADLVAAKQEMVRELNAYVQLKKHAQELMEEGRSQVRETDEALARSVRVVEDTIKVGATTAQALREQTEQIRRVEDDLDDMEFTLKKAGKVLQEITRGLATDKCIMCFLLLVVIGVGAIIAIKVADPSNEDIRFPGEENYLPTDVSANVTGLSGLDDPASSGAIELTERVEGAVRGLFPEMAAVHAEIASVGRRRSDRRLLQAETRVVLRIVFVQGDATKGAVEIWLALRGATIADVEITDVAVPEEYEPPEAANPDCAAVESLCPTTCNFCPLPP
eukprot:PRCOL_00002993-RA